MYFLYSAVWQMSSFMINFVLLVVLPQVTLTAKRKWYITTAIPLFFMVIQHLIVMLNDGIPDFWPMPFVMLTVYIINNVMMYQEKFWTKVIIAISGSLIVLFSELMLMMFFNFTNTDKLLFRREQAIATSAELTVVIFFVLIYAYVFKKIVRKDVFENFGLFIIFPISQYILMLDVLYGVRVSQYYMEAMISGDYSNVEFRIVIFAVILLAGNVLAILADIILYRVNRENALNKELKESLELAELRNRLELEYYSRMQENIDETRKIRHDFYNILSAIDTASNTLPDDIKKEITETLRKSSVPMLCENRIVSLVIMNKMKICDEKGIKFTADLNVPENIHISKLDLLRVFGNIIDNAIEANNRLSENEDKWIELYAKIENHYLYIRSENPTDGQTVKNGSKYRTSKKQKTLHGYGMIILNDIAEKYGGKLMTDIEENIFRLLITIGLKEI